MDPNSGFTNNWSITKIINEQYIYIVAVGKSILSNEYNNNTTTINVKATVDMHILLKSNIFCVIKNLLILAFIINYMYLIINIFIY